MRNLTFSVNLDKKYDLDLSTDLDIKKESINEELSKQPALYAWYATLAELAKAKSAQLKNAMDTFYAEMDVMIRKGEYKDSDGIKLTETSIESLIKSSGTYKKLMSQYLDAKKDESLLGVASEAFEQKKDMLISLASNMRAELDTDFKILKDKVATKIEQARSAK